jgi:hypothetical protein
MALSRTRKKELDSLRSSASGLWDDQKELLEHASQVVREATHHATDTGRDEVASRLSDAADSARGHVNRDVLPAVSSAMASALALLEVAKDPRVKAAIAKVGRTGTDLGSRVGVKPQKAAGPGRYILIGLGLVAVAGVAYAAWQTLRADDELWVSDNLDDEPAASPES